jgi:hypothetical protein
MAAELARGGPESEGHAALQVFRRWARAEGRWPLLLDNIDIVLDRPRAQQWGLGRVLQQAGGIVVVGASATRMEVAADREAAFYDLFQVIVPERLRDDGLIESDGRADRVLHEQSLPRRRTWSAQLMSACRRPRARGTEQCLQR